MDSIVITGNGPLKGETHASGAKNAALPILASSLLAEGEHHYRNVPDLAAVSTILRVLRTIGWECDWSAERHEVAIRVPKNVPPEAPYELVKTMRASVLVLGPLT